MAARNPGRLCLRGAPPPEHRRRPSPPSAAAELVAGPRTGGLQAVRNRRGRHRAAASSRTCSRPRGPARGPDEGVHAAGTGRPRRSAPGATKPSFATLADRLRPHLEDRRLASRWTCSSTPWGDGRRRRGQRLPRPRIRRPGRPAGARLESSTASAGTSPTSSLDGETQGCGGRAALGEPGHAFEDDVELDLVRARTVDRVVCGRGRDPTFSPPGVADPSASAVSSSRCSTSSRSAPAPIQVERVTDEAHDGRRHERARSQQTGSGGGARPACNARSGSRYGRPLPAGQGSSPVPFAGTCSATPWGRPAPPRSTSNHDLASGVRDDRRPGVPLALRTSTVAREPRWLLSIPDAINQLEQLDRTLLTRRDVERRVEGPGRRRCRARRQTRGAPAHEAPAAAQEAPRPGRVPRRGGETRAPGRPPRP